MKRFIRFLKERTFVIIVTGSLVLASMFLAALIYLVAFLLGPPSLASEQNTIYFSQTGEVIGDERGIENRYTLEPQAIPPMVITATLAIEDQHFYRHHGFDLKRMIKAAFADLQSLSLKEGASTLTQQYARNLFLSHEKTWTRKLKEAFYTIRLEMFYTKEELLTGYLNTIYYGHGAYGIETASRYYFDKSVHELTLGEIALLVGIPKGPTYYSPLNNYTRAKERQQHILNVLLDQKKISETEFAEASKEHHFFQIKRKTVKKDIGPYFLDTALKEAAHLLDIEQEAIRSGGFQIYTTLNIKVQQLLEEKITNTIGKESKINIGATAMNPSTGEVEALVGGRNYEESPFNRAISAKRMPGSTFKPFLYYSALNNDYTATTKLLSKETSFMLENDEIYQPRNFNGYYANEPITLAKALALSDNIYAVKTNLFLGPDTLANTAQTFGITSPLPAVPSLALGTASVSVHEMVTAYSMLANGGYDIHGHTIRKIIDKNGAVVFEREGKRGKQKLDPQSTFILTDLMTGMFDASLNGYMSVTGSSIANKLTRTYAGKSGSTPYDSWMIGYSPSLVTGIWTGYDNNEKIEKVVDTTYAKNIWADFMEAAHMKEANKKFPVPKGVVQVSIDPETGDRATPYCPTNRLMYFVEGTEPKHHCREHFPDEKEILEVENKEKNRGIFQQLFELFIGN